MHLLMIMLALLNTIFLTIGMFKQTTKEMFAFYTYASLCSFVTIFMGSDVSLSVLCWLLILVLTRLKWIKPQHLRIGILTLEGIWMAYGIMHIALAVLFLWHGVKWESYMFTTFS